MSQPQVQQQGSAPKDTQYEIRMKPGKGRMLIGRRWNVNGTLTEERPRTADAITESVDEYLEARVEESEGIWSEGPTAIVSAAKLKAMMIDGKPDRLIEGYTVNHHKGGMIQDQSGAMVASRDVFAPGQHPGVSHDATFEIVRKL